MAATSCYYCAGTVGNVTSLFRSSAAPKPFCFAHHAPREPPQYLLYQSTANNKSSEPISYVSITVWIFPPAALQSPKFARQWVTAKRRGRRAQGETQGGGGLHVCVSPPMMHDLSFTPCWLFTGLTCTYLNRDDPALPHGVLSLPSSGSLIIVRLSVSHTHTHTHTHRIATLTNSISAHLHKCSRSWNVRIHREDPINVYLFHCYHHFTLCHLASPRHNINYFRCNYGSNQLQPL